MLCCCSIAWPLLTVYFTGDVHLGAIIGGIISGLIALSLVVIIAVTVAVIAFKLKPKTESEWYQCMFLVRAEVQDP